MPQLAILSSASAGLQTQISLSPKPKFLPSYQTCLPRGRLAGPGLQGLVPGTPPDTVFPANQHAVANEVFILKTYECACVSACVCVLDIDTNTFF